MSSYQADWFQDEEGHADFHASVLAGGEAGSDEEGEEGQPLDAEEEDEEGLDGADDDMSVAGDNQRSGSAKKLLRAALAKDDMEFPDEVQTPSDVAARLRFARYRALQSFRASPWHPKENLPADYAKIFQFENFPGTQRRILSDSRVVEQMQQSADLQIAKSSKASARSSGSVVSARALREEQRQDEMMCEEAGDAEDEAAAMDQGEDDRSHLTVSGAPDFIRAGLPNRTSPECSSDLHLCRTIPASTAQRRACRGGCAIAALWLPGVVRPVPPREQAVRDALQRAAGRGQRRRRGGPDPLQGPAALPGGLPVFHGAAGVQ